MEERAARKNSLTLYRSHKKEIREERIYDNRPASTILYKARANILPLKDRNRHVQKDTHCPLCGDEDTIEDIYHFMLYCPAYTEQRSNIKQLQQPYESNKDLIVGTFLFEDENIEKKKEDLYNMWRARTRQLMALQ